MAFRAFPYLIPYAMRRKKQMIIVGIVAQFVTLFVAIMLYLARKGKTLPLRKLKSLKAIDEVVG